MYTKKRLLAMCFLTAVNVLMVGCTSTNSNSPTQTPSATINPSPTPNPTSSQTPSSTASSTPSPTPSPSPSPSSSATPISTATPINGNVPSEQAKPLIAARTAAVISAIKDKDMKKLATYVHPEHGVRFSPYTFVDKTANLVFKAEQIPNLFTDTTLYNWGNQDGSGDPIKLRFADYYAKFIYNHDFIKPEKVSYNEPLGKGNTINNTRTVYPQAIIVEYHFSGFDKQFEGMDWASLKLVFENHNNEWYLVGIVHDQWTI